VIVANPQKENGHTSIANEIFEALIRYRIPGEERQCLDFIIRKTWGWQKKDDYIPLSQFVEATGMKRQSVTRALNSLASKGLIVRSKSAAESVWKYRFNKDFDGWARRSKKAATAAKVLPTRSKSAADRAAKTLPSKETTKETAKEIQDIHPPTPKKSPFTPPSLEEVRAFWRERGYMAPEVEPEKFWAYYQSNGWRVGRNPMRDWHAAAAGWNSRNGGTAEKPKHHESQAVGWTDEMLRDHEAENQNMLRQALANKAMRERGATKETLNERL